MFTFQQGVSSQGTLCTYFPGGGEFPGDLMCLLSRRGDFLRGLHVLTFQEGVSSQGTLRAYFPGGGEFLWDFMCLLSRRG